MKLYQLACTTVVVLASSVLADTIDSPGDAMIIPAATEVTPTPGENLFEFETLQLVDESLEQLDKSSRTLFEFADEDDSDALAKRTFFKCKVFPGDFFWPAKWTWKVFDLLSGGALIKAVPQAISCYEGPAYDQEKCAYLTEEWTNSYIHVSDPTEVLSPFYQGLTCQPTDNPTDSCTLGGYPEYAVNVTNVAQVQLAVNFARTTGIRLIIKNTGHDFSGKSVGAGSLSIWTHNLKDIEFIERYDAKDSDWTGPAFKLGAGVLAYDVYKAASEHGVIVVGGEGQTVGVMGGYILGGGHSPLSSLYGIAADHILSMEVVKPNGRFVTASPSQNSDLFWALRGGGGSTFGVVTSVTVRAFPEIPVTTSTFSFSTGPDLSHETFWKGVRAYFDYFIPHSDAGVYAYFFVIPTGPDRMFLMQPFFAPNKTLSETESLLNPFLTQLAALNIPVSPTTKSYTNYYDAWLASFPLEAMSTPNYGTGSRLFPRANWEDPAKLDATFDAWKKSSEQGYMLINFNMAPGRSLTGVPDNAVNLAWRDTIMHAIQNINWPLDATVDEIKEYRYNLTYVDTQRWRDVSPGAGAYLGEADRMEPDFQREFWGDKYERLLRIKRKVDPWDVFWAATAVGSEGWEVVTQDGLPTENGRLCRV